MKFKRISHRGAVQSGSRSSAVRGARPHFVETLEKRAMLAADTAAWHNAIRALDVNNDSHYSPIDALMVINDLNSFGTRRLLASGGGAQSQAFSLSANGNSATGLAATSSTSKSGFIDVNNDGAVSPLDALMVINAINAGPLEVRIRINITDLAGNDLTTIAQGQQFKINALVTDLRNPPTNAGVFSAYSDVTYDSTKITIPLDAIKDPKNEVTFAAFYNSAQNGDLTTPGLIDEVGASGSSFSGQGAGEFPLWSVVATATAAGVVSVSPDPADDPLASVLVYGDNEVVPTDQVDYVGDSLIITPAAALPFVSISDVTSNEGNAGTKNFLFSVSLSAPSATPVTVIYNTANGTAVSGGDYTATTGTVTFAANSTAAQTINVSVNGDSLNEPDETFSVNLASAVGAIILDGTGLGTITNDDLAPTISINDVTQAEGNSGVGNFIFTVSLSAASSLPITVVYGTSDGSANSSSDYTATSGTLTFAAGSISQTVSVPVIGDTIVEPNETFNVNLTSPTNATLSDAFGLGTITNDDVGPTFSINNVTVAEGNSGSTNATFTVTLSQISAQTTTVAYATSDGTATADRDYTAQSGTLTFAAGTTSQTVTVPVIGDRLNETNETFRVTLSNPSNAGLTNAVGTGVIDNDDPFPVISITPVVSQNEGNSGVGNQDFIVSLSAESGQIVTVVYATSNGSALAGSDYVAKTGTLTFFPGTPGGGTSGPGPNGTGMTSRTISVVVNGDTTNEADETYSVTLSSPTNATLGTAVGVGTIGNDDPQPIISINDVAKAEGNSGTSNLSFTVSLSAASGLPVTVVYGSSNDTAAAGSDYTAVNGTVTFAAGTTTQTVNVPILGDTVTEANERFNINLSAPTNATLADNLGVGTITNDDAVPSLSVNDVTQAEGNVGTSNFIFTVTLNAASQLAATVVYTTADSTAAAGSDYVAQTGTLTFAAGETSKTVIVVVNSDTQNEANETFQLNLTSPDNATLADGQGIGTITNDDPLPTVSINDISVTEGNAGTTAQAQFTVTLSAASGQTVVVPYSTVNGTARAPSDFVTQTGAVTFSAGETSKTINIVVNGENFFESDQTFNVNLGAPTNATLADGSGTATILNDDPVGSIEPSTLSGHVFLDPNNNGVQNTGEKPFSGVTIRLTGTDETGDTVDVTAITDSTGLYTFEEVIPGDYVIAETQPAAYRDGIDTVGSEGGTKTSNDHISLTLDGGVNATGYNFAEIGPRPEFGSLRGQLASTPTNNNVNSINVSSAPALFSLDAGWNGTLTAQAKANGTGGQPQLTLLNSKLEPVATSSGSAARIDFQGTAGEPYFLQVGGGNTNVDLTLTNLVNAQNGVVQVRGTDGNDVFEFDAANPANFSINGVTYQLNPNNVSNVTFDGGKGLDTATLYGSAADDLATIGLGYGSLASARYNVSVSKVESLGIDGGGGNDSVNLVDSAFADALNGGGGVLTYDAPGFHGELNDFDKVHAASTHGGADTKHLTAIDYVFEQEGIFSDV